MDPAANDTEAKLFYNNMFSLHGGGDGIHVHHPGGSGSSGEFHPADDARGQGRGVSPAQSDELLHLSRLARVSSVWVLIGGILRILFGLHVPFGYGLDTGWTFYTPFSTSKAEDGMVAVVAGVFILGFSSILTGVNFIATIHTLRPGE